MDFEIPAFVGQVQGLHSKDEDLTDTNGPAHLRKEFLPLIKYLAPLDVCQLNVKTIMKMTQSVIRKWI